MARWFRGGIHLSTIGGLNLNFTMSGSAGARCFERMYIVDPKGNRVDEIAYIRVQVLNTNPLPAKGCIAKCEVWSEDGSSLLLSRERLAWQPRTAKDATDPMDILPNDHEFLVLAWSQKGWRGHFTFATRKAYDGVPTALGLGRYRAKVEVISENAGHVTQTFLVTKGRAWDDISASKIGRQERVPAPTIDIGSQKLPQPAAVEGALFERLVAADFEAKGYSIEDAPKPRDLGIDFIARRNGETLLVEVKAYRESLVTESAVLQLLAASKRFGDPNARLVLVSTTGFNRAAMKLASSYAPRVQLVTGLGFLKDIKLSSMGPEAKRVVVSLQDMKPVMEERDSMLDQLCQTFRTAAGTRAKGRSLQALLEYAFACIPHCSVTARNAKTDTEEIDIIVANESEQTFWKSLGNPILVECKNWTGKTHAPDLLKFGAVMEVKCVRTGVIIAAGGFTRGYKKVVREQRRSVRTLIPLDGNDIGSICEGVSIGDLIRNRFYESYRW